MPKCPVCKTNITETTLKCGTCGFDDLHRTFINLDEATQWMNDTVLPLRTKWERENNSWNSWGDEVTRYTGTDEIVTIPSKFKKIRQFSNFTERPVRHLIVPPTISRICDDAFRWNRELKSVVIQGKWFVIEKHAFAGCDVTVYLENIEYTNHYSIGDKIMANSLRNLPYKKYWKGEWHYDAQGNPVPNKKKY